MHELHKVNVAYVAQITTADNIASIDLKIRWRRRTSDTSTRERVYQRCGGRGISTDRIDQPCKTAGAAI